MVPMKYWNVWVWCLFIGCIVNFISIFIGGGILNIFAATGCGIAFCLRVFFKQKEAKNDTESSGS